MKILEAKIKKAIKTNKLNPEILGERRWYSYFIRSTELIWSTNLHSGYLIEVYDEKYGSHLTTVII
ncbi:MAG TPA: hypothetical protein VF677_02415 [Flavobacterium sp.]|jgi:hypothetical protein